MLFSCCHKELDQDGDDWRVKVCRTAGKTIILHITLDILNFVGCDNEHEELDRDENSVTNFKNIVENDPDYHHGNYYKTHLSTHQFITH